MKLSPSGRLWPRPRNGWPSRAATRRRATPQVRTAAFPNLGIFRASPEIPGSLPEQGDTDSEFEPRPAHAQSRGSPGFSKRERSLRLCRRFAPDEDLAGGVVPAPDRPPWPAAVAVERIRTPPISSSIESPFRLPQAVVCADPSAAHRGFNAHRAHFSDRPTAFPNRRLDDDPSRGGVTSSRK